MLELIDELPLIHELEKQRNYKSTIKGFKQINNKQSTKH